MGVAFALTRFGERTSDQTADKLRAFEGMVARDWDRFYRYAYRLCGNSDDAEDLLSDSLVEAFQSFDQYRGSGFDRWMFRILTTNRIDMARRAKVRKTESMDTAWLDESGESVQRDVADTGSDPLHALIDPMISEEMEEALSSLSEDFRIAVLLCDVEQMDYQEIAQALALPLGTVRSRIHRGRNQLRQALMKCKSVSPSRA